MNLLGSRPNAQLNVEFTASQVQTSAEAMCIPILWGQNLIAGNLIWVNNFQAQPLDGKNAGKGGGGKGASEWTYSEAFILALCEGPIDHIALTWINGAHQDFSTTGLTLYTGTQTQEPPSYVTSNYPDEAQSYAYTAYVFNSSYNLGSSGALPSFQFETIGPLGGSMSPYYDANFADIILDYLTNAQYGVVGFPSGSIDTGNWDFFKTYCTAQALFGSPALTTQEQGITTLERWTALCNTWIFWSGAALKFVPLGDQAITANGVTYTPVTTVVYALDMDDFVFDPKTEAPVTVTRIDPADGYNRVELDVRDRSNQYQNTPIYWEDQATLDQFGLLQSNTISAPEICDTGIAATMAALIGQRSVFLRNTYSFKVPYYYVLLEPGDIVTITEPNIGLSAFPVRIKSVTEGDDMLLAITAEEFPGSVGQVLYPRPQQTGAGTQPPNRLVDPGPVNPPAIFEPSPAVTSGQPQVWVGLSGGANWGGADIYLSADGTNYAWIGDVTAATQQGELSAGLPEAADPDTTDTLSVDMTESDSVLSTAVTSADADAFRTAALIDNEIIAYGTVTPTGANTANLTYLRRGIYDTTPAAHSSGATFSRINPASTFIYALPEAYVGVEIYFKFCSFNLFGGGNEDISDVTAYPYTPVGVAYTIAAPTSPALTVGRTTQADGATLLAMTLAWTASAGPQLASYEVQFSADGGSTWPTDVSVGGATTSFTLSPAVAATSYQARVRAISTNGLAISSWATSSVVSSGSLVAAVPGAPTGLSATPTGTQVALAWTAPGSGPVNSYQIWRAAGTGASFGSAALIGSTVATAYTDSSCAISTAYTWFIVAVNAAGSSSASGGASAATGVSAGVLRFYFAAGSAGPYTASQSLFVEPLVMLGNEVLPASLAGSTGTCKVAPSGSISCTLTVNGSAIGTVNYAAGVSTPTFALSGGYTATAGDLLDLLAPATLDAAFSGPSLTLVGTRTS